MRIWIIDRDGKRIDMQHPYNGCAWVEAKDGAVCPHCQNPLKARMPHPSVEDHATYAGVAVCEVEDCGRSVGTMRVRMNTLFGVEEDNRILNGRYRVY